MFDRTPFIIVIDDDEEDLEMLSCLLAEHEVRVMTFRSGHNALSYFENASIYEDLPALIIVDYNMPLLNGLETMLQIKMLEAISHIPLVIYSTTINPLLDLNARALGAVECEPKACDMIRLKEQAARFAAMAYSFARPANRSVSKC